MSKTLVLRRWKSPGPVSTAYMQSQADFQLIQGPIGGGKTSTNLVKVLRYGMRQRPSTRDGVRRLWCCVVHKTYRQLWRSTIPSWFKWMPKSAGSWTGATNDPARHKLDIALPDGTKLELIMDFIAIGDHVVEEVLRGYEPTIFFLNEIDLLPEDILDHSEGRTGRYPSMDEGGPTWHGVLADCNAPFIGSWLWEMVTAEIPEGMVYLSQPSGLSPQAENLENLPPDYYAKRTRRAKKHYLDRMVRNKFGHKRDGEPVWDEFNEHLHVAPEDLPLIRGLPLIVGLDAGGTPAATLWQHMPNSQWRGLDELVAGKGKGGEGGPTGPKRFARDLNRLLTDRFAGAQRIEGWADPSAFYGADKQDDEKNWVQMVANICKFPIRAAPGENRLQPRLEAVRGPLEVLIDGETPGLLLSPRMIELRRAMGGAYKYKKTRLRGGETRREPEPDKNDFSHVADSAQYALLGGGDFAEIMGREKAASGGPRQRYALDEKDPHGERAFGQAVSRRQRRQRYAEG